MNRTKGLILLYSILGIAFVGIIAVLLIPERVQFAAEPETVESPVPTKAPDNSDVVFAVGRHMLLPSETPQVITLEDADTRKKDQPFFTNASNGDKLLIYTSKVILYSPILDKIVEIAQIKP